MGVTLAEAATLGPPMTQAQLAALVVLAGISPSGVRRTGRKGRPPGTYDLAAIRRAHAEEAARTSKQFADTDWIAAALLARNLIRADTDAGALWWPDGTRAEQLHAGTGYGYVKAGPQRCAAHRIIWIAANGEIPYGLQVNHRNRLHWDNRSVNLEIVSFGENVRHARGQPYLTYHDAVAQLAAVDPGPEVAPLAESLVRAGGAFRHPGH